MNPVMDGRRLKCFCCDSLDHMKQACDKHKEHKEKLKEQKGDEWRKEDTAKEDKPKMTLSLIGSGRGRGNAYSKFTMVMEEQEDEQHEADKGFNEVFGEL